MHHTPHFSAGHTLPSHARLWCGSLLVAAVLLGSGAAQAENHPADRPNVILILTDDQGFGDLGRAGEGDCNEPSADPANCQHPLETALAAAGLEGFTPNIDQLRNEGVRFSDFHVTPACATTRASLHTGRFNHRTGVLHPLLDRQILSPDETTLAEQFSEAGYRTGMFGKWNLGDQPPARPQDRGFDVVMKSGGAGHGLTSDFWQNDCFGDTYVDENGHGVSFGPDHDTPQPGDRYCTDIFFGEAKAFI
ncbi:MAG: sulfatase-like hydrolase/transferase, partial [Longimicrobiales bacterium]